jgi:hypothetical protein
MPSPTWDEYLEDASAHLGTVRLAVERGDPPPTPPGRPDGVVPDDCRDRAQRLALGYDQLTVEVVARLANLAQRGSASVRRSPHHEPRPARYIDIPV